MDWQIVANIVQTSALIVTILIFTITFRHQVRASHVQTFEQLEGTYNEIARLRASNPDVLALGKSWKPENLDLIYSVSPDARWGRYYSYGEMCIGFCNTCVYLHQEGHIPSKTYSDFFEGLVNLLISENEPLFRQIVDLPFCSESFRSLMLHWKPTEAT